MDPYLFDRVSRSIGDYASPEAAERDYAENAPQANEEYIRRYQALSGDAFADPWEGLRDRRDAGLMSAAMQGAGVATGNIATGPTLLSPPRPVATLQQPIATGAVPGTIANAVASGIRSKLGTIQAPLTDDMQARVDPFNFALRKPELQLPTQPTTPAFQPPRNFGDMASAVAGGAVSALTPHSNFQNVQRKRANVAGTEAARLFDFYQKNNPDVLKPPILGHQTVEFDEENKPISGEVLHHKLYNDPRFQALLNANRPQAANFYRAITDRDLDTDLKMQGGREASMQKAGQSTVDALVKQGLTQDPVSGEWYTVKQVQNELEPGAYKEIRTPLGDAEKEYVRKYYTARTGLPVGEGLDVSGAGPLSPESQTALRKAVSELRQDPANAGKSNQALMVIAQAKLFGVAEPTGKSWWEKPEQAANIVANAGERFLGGFWNKTHIDPINRVLPSGFQLPRFAPSGGEKPVSALVDRFGDLLYGGVRGAEDADIDYSMALSPMHTAVSAYNQLK